MWFVVDMGLILFLGLYLISWLPVNGKESPTVISIPVKGQKDMVFKEGDNPCKVLKKYCKSSQTQLPYETCSSPLPSLYGTEFDITVAERSQ